MAISKLKAYGIEKRFMNAVPPNRTYTKENALKIYKAWNHLYKVMESENNFSDNLGYNYLEVGIGNWASDTTEYLWNAKLYEKVIEVNEQILNISFSYSNALFHENAKRELADAYFYMGNKEHCLDLYRKYLESDPLWGWGWIGYLRILKAAGDECFISVLNELFENIVGGTEYLDEDVLFMELEDEYAALGMTDKGNALKDTFYKKYCAECDAPGRADCERRNVCLKPME